MTLIAAPTAMTLLAPLVPIVVPVLVTLALMWFVTTYIL